MTSTDDSDGLSSATTSLWLFSTSLFFHHDALLAPRVGRDEPDTRPSSRHLPTKNLKNISALIGFNTLAQQEKLASGLGKCGLFAGCLLAGCALILYRKCNPRAFIGMQA